MSKLIIIVATITVILIAILVTLYFVYKNKLKEILDKYTNKTNNPTTSINVEKAVKIKDEYGRYYCGSSSSEDSIGFFASEKTIALKGVSETPKIDATNILFKFTDQGNLLHVNSNKYLNYSLNEKQSSSTNNVSLSVTFKGFLLRNNVVNKPNDTYTIENNKIKHVPTGKFLVGTTFMVGCSKPNITRSISADGQTVTYTDSINKTTQSFKSVEDIGVLDLGDVNLASKCLNVTLEYV